MTCLLTHHTFEVPYVSSRIVFFFVYQGVDGSGALHGT